MRIRLGVCLALLAALTIVPGGGAAPQARTVLLGAFGDYARFDSMTGQRTRVGHVIMSWGQATGPRLDRMLAGMREVPMLGIGTNQGRPITPLAIARGEGDDFLVDLNRAVAAFPGPRIYIRPFGEMNGHWNDYSAFNKDGTSRGPARSTAAFKKAFARLYVIVHGGPRVNAELARLGLPPVRAELAHNPFPRARVIWNPQGYGSPNIPANAAQAYYPGDRYVDVVGNDLYNIRFKAEWAANEALYRAHPKKPYAIPEWGNWSIDDPAFVKRMAEFVRTHPRVELVAYFNSRAGSPWDLGTKPKSRQAYRQHIAPLGR